MKSFKTTQPSSFYQLEIMRLHDVYCFFADMKIVRAGAKLAQRWHVSIRENNQEYFVAEGLPSDVIGENTQ